MLDLDPPQWIDRRSPRHKASRYAYMAQIISMHTLTPAPFSDEVHDMGDFVNAHPEILGDDVQIISRELEHGTDGRRLDFLVYDTESNQPGLVELKKDVADEKFLLQTLRYADWLRSNPDTIRYQLSRQQVDLDPDDVEGDIKIYIVAPRILPVVAELAQYIQGFEFAFIQLERFQGTDGDYLAAVTPLEVPNRTAPRTRARFDHDWQTYRFGASPRSAWNDSRSLSSSSSKSARCESVCHSDADRHLNALICLHGRGSIFHADSQFAIQISLMNSHRGSLL